MGGIKICEICKKEIKKEDNYCRLTDYKLGEFFSEGFYHTKCYNDQIKGMNPDQVKMKKMALGMLGKANQLLHRSGLVKEEYHIQ